MALEMGLGIGVGLLLAFGAGVVVGRRSVLPSPAAVPPAAPALPPPERPALLADPDSRLVWHQQSGAYRTGRFEGHPFVVRLDEAGDRIVEVRLRATGMPTDVSFGIARDDEQVLGGSAHFVQAPLEPRGHVAHLFAMVDDVVVSLLGRLVEAGSAPTIEAGRIVLRPASAVLGSIEDVLQDAADLLPRLRLDPADVNRRLGARMGSLSRFAIPPRIRALVRRLPPGPRRLEAAVALCGDRVPVLVGLEAILGEQVWPALLAAVDDEALPVEDRASAVHWLIERPQLPDRVGRLARVLGSGAPEALRRLAAEALVRAGEAVSAVDLEVLDSFGPPQRAGDNATWAVSPAGPGRPRRLRLTVRWERPASVSFELLRKERGADGLRAGLMCFGGVVPTWLRRGVLCGDPAVLLAWLDKAVCRALNAWAERYEVVVRPDGLVLTWDGGYEAGDADEVEAAMAVAAEVRRAVPAEDLDVPARLVEGLHDRSRTRGLERRLELLLANPAWASYVPRKRRELPEGLLGVDVASGLDGAIERLRELANDTTSNTVVRWRAIVCLLQHYGGEAALPALQDGLEVGPDRLRRSCARALARLTPGQVDARGLLEHFERLTPEVVEDVVDLLARVAEQPAERSRAGLLDSTRVDLLRSALAGLARHPTPRALEALARLEAHPAVGGLAGEVLRSTREIFGASGAGGMSIVADQGALALGDVPLGGLSRLGEGT